MIEILTTLIKCLFSFRFAKKKDFVPKTVLVVQLAWLGDMVCTTPVFRAIKEKYPSCRVLVLGMQRNEKLLYNHPDIDKYINWENRQELKNENIDFACITSPNFFSLSYLYLLGIKSIAVPKIENGYSPYETISFKILRYFVLAIPHRMGNYAPREYLKLLEPIGIFSDKTKKYLTFSKEAENKVNIFLSGFSGFFVAISPSAGNKIKNWPTERFAHVANTLIEKYKAKVFVIGSSMDKEEVEKMSELSPQSINTIGMFSVDELKAFISKMNCFISVDTGPIYIAEAFNIPTIDIVGPMDPNEQPPIGEIHKIVKPNTNPTIHIMNSRVYDKEKAIESINSITTNMVLETFDDLHKKII